MPQAIWYGLAAALGFIGFISIVYYILLWFYRPRGNGKYIIFIPEDADDNEIDNLIYGAHVRNLLFGDLVCDEVVILDCGLSDDKRRLIKNASAHYGEVKICTSDELCLGEKDGTGIS